MSNTMVAVVMKLFYVLKGVILLRLVLLRVSARQ